MKKLMIAAAIVCAAVMTQAASFTWASKSYFNGIAADTLAAGLTAGTTYSTVNSAATRVSAEAFSGLTYTMILDFGGGVKEEITGDLAYANTISTPITLKSVTIEDYKAQDVTYDIVINGKLTDGKGTTWDVTTDHITGTWTVQNTGTIGLKTNPNTKWTTDAVPEPTSGLLLLLGVAGLALRRRRA